MEVHYLLILFLMPVRMPVSGGTCPPWFTEGSSAYPQCVCSGAMESVVTCNQREGASYVKMGHCAYHDICTNETVAAYCPYVFPLHLVKNGLIHLPQNLTDLNNFMLNAKWGIYSVEDVGMVLDHLCIHLEASVLHTYMSLDKYSLLHYAAVRCNYSHIISHYNIQNQHGGPSFWTLHYVL